MSDYNKIGLTYLKEKQLEKAAEAFNQAIETNPQNPVGYTNFGNLLLSIHEYEKALPFFERAIELDRGQGSAYYGTGNAYYNLQDYDRASRYFLEALNNGIEEADVHFMAGMSYVHLGQPMMGLVHLQRACEINEKDTEARFQYALCLAKLEHLTLAQEQFENVIKRDDSHADAFYNLGLIAFYNEAIDEADRLFKKALAIQNDHMLAANGLKKIRANRASE